MMTMINISSSCSKSFLVQYVLGVEELEVVSLKKVVCTFVYAGNDHCTTCNMLGLVSYSLLMNTMMLLIVKNCNKAWDMGFAVCGLDRVVMGGRLLRTRDYCTHSSCY